MTMGNRETEPLYSKRVIWTLALFENIIIFHSLVLPLYSVKIAYSSF